MKAWLLAASWFASAAALAEPITDKASATQAAKRYLKARCTAETPCTFKPEREGKQWRVWVRLPKKTDGSLVLYFDNKGNLTRRLEAD